MSDYEGFGQGFHREVEALCALWDRGAFPSVHEFRLNLAKAGVELMRSIPTPDIEPPDPTRFIDDETETREAA